MWIWRRMEHVNWTDILRNEAVLERVDEERMMLKHQKDEKELVGSLGQLVSFHQKTEKEIKRRISLAWKAFWSLKFIVLEGTLSKKLRVEILETCVTPVLLYGCQTWSLTAKLRNSLQICQRKILRKILGLSLRDRVPNEVLQKMAAIKDPALQATNTKWKWGGHVARLRDGKWTQKVTLWIPALARDHPEDQEEDGQTSSVNK
ncbi:hypothetical protein ANN_02172 [Periplaneta americana]|uniref:Endonuclease-reverse transcriptase n=1 Tax=Periplaneta americana TaxID=6978 RepID=A0ABQ8TXC2_PERAM|nr:hypothetical protein ANN_02172 [Periplaneta americana]